MDKNPTLQLNIRDAANIIDVTPTTVRNWEKYGLIAPKRRSNGYRYYEPSDINRMRKIKHYLIDEHYNLKIVKSILEPQSQISPDLQNFLELNAESMHGTTASSVHWGKKLKETRCKKGMTLEQVGYAVGISPSYLSKIENTQINVSYNILVKLAEYYNESLLSLTATKSTGPQIIHEDRSQNIESNFLGTEARMLSTLDGKAIFPILFVIQPHCGSLEAHKHSGEAFVYCLSGKIIVTLDNQKDYVLSAGDSFHFPATSLHFWRNPTNQKSKAIWVFCSLSNDTGGLHT